MHKVDRLIKELYGKIDWGGGAVLTGGSRRITLAASYWTADTRLHRRYVGHITSLTLWEQ